MNRVEIRGGLVRDPEFKFVGVNSTALLTMTLAVNGTRYDHSAGAQVVKTTYVAVDVWGLTAEEVMENYGLVQGDDVHVVGELDQREVEKGDGKKERKTRVTAFVVSVIRAKNGRQGKQQQQAVQPPGDPWSG